ncbi:hypothetical protein [Salirhabdus salicampi]|uniref:hypothetical protein n=1 Tax=Salirhabdus salicampi TaxID=476102 RepID=UPI0020C57BB8|nr:hypothetical protein [Salirhabdus salicampi]MCP8615631.1 hypothetical protein [Salirhabdus salicampi]
MKTIITNKIEFQKKEIKTLLDQLDPKISFQVDRLVYYPYYFFEYSVKQHKFLRFMNRNGNIGCTIDSLSGTGALIDATPQFNRYEASEDELISSKLDVITAQKEAEKYIYRSISLKMKILQMPEMQLTKQELFYRPYWIASSKTSDRSFSLAIDAISGKYHPL